MKIVNLSYCISAVVLATTILLLTVNIPSTQSAPTMVGLKTTDFMHLQQCLLNGNLSVDPASLCYLLLHPTAANSHPKKLSPSEQTTRTVFYTEAASLNRVFLSWNRCALTISAPDSPRERCRLRLADYGGFYLRDFAMDRYGLRERFADGWPYSFPSRNEAVAGAAHCYLHHGQDGRTLPPQLASCAPYDHLTVGNVGQRAPGLANHLIHYWKRATLERHRLLVPNVTSPLYWRQEETIFHCLFDHPSKHDNLSALGSIITADSCGDLLTWKALNRGLTNSFGSVPVPGGLTRFQVHLLDFLRAELVYDCLRYHRFAKGGAAPWCKGVLEQLGGCPGTVVEHPHTALLHSVLKLVENEEAEELAWWERSADLPFQVLPFRIRKLCIQYRACGDKLAYRRPPADCKKGGLYWPFLNRLEAPLKEEEEVPEK